MICCKINRCSKCKKILKCRDCEDKEGYRHFDTDREYPQQCSLCLFSKKIYCDKCLQDHLDGTQHIKNLLTLQKKPQTTQFMVKYNESFLDYGACN